MTGVVCHYFSTGSGRLPVEEFIDSLDMRTRLKFFYVRRLLEEFGHRLPMPHAKRLGEGVFELRFSGREGAIRVLYFFDRGKAVLTNGFIKKKNKTPKTEIETAVQRRKLYDEGMK
ncbi:MAG: type II toxin-antitoxin system RelE/ParE family toxin [Candidatus Omnitrophica bacterium]|nr:type II toxin-antitoxin system RelE/ParE family toxin [Candidatus Omnitrophota bacterium]